MNECCLDEEEGDDGTFESGLKGSGDFFFFSFFKLLTDVSY